MKTFILGLILTFTFSFLIAYDISNKLRSKTQSSDSIGPVHETFIKNDTIVFKDCEIYNAPVEEIKADTLPFVVSGTGLMFCNIRISKDFGEACLSGDSLIIKGDTLKLFKFAMKEIIKANERYIKLDTTIR